MASANDKIIKLTAKKFNKKREKLLPSGIQCKLLAKASLTGNFNTLYVVDDWWHTYDKYRLQTIVQVATQNTSFREAFERASDIQVGQDIFEIAKRDSKPPDGNRPYWEIRAQTGIEYE